MAETAHILLVDDDPMMIEIEKFQLGEDKYRFSVAENGLDALGLIARARPQVILLDITMPELDGLETCRRIRNDSDNDGIHIIFVTSHNDAETQQAAYEAGGDDVLAKPLNPTEIQNKVEHAVKIQQRVASLRKDMSDAMGMVMSAITASGKYGVVMNAQRKFFGCRSVGDLAEVILQALDDFDLNGSVQLRTNTGIVTLNSERRCSPLEQEMLHKLSLENKHIYDYGTRTAFCYPNTAILIKNMPLNDPEAYGRIKDNVALLAEGGELRLSALEEEMKTRQQRETLASSAALVSHILDKVEAQFKVDQSEMSTIFRELESGLEWAISGLALTDHQEKTVWNIVRPLAARALSLYDQGVALDAQLTGALQSLKLSLQEGGSSGEQDIWL